MTNSGRVLFNWNLVMRPGIYIQVPSIDQLVAFLEWSEELGFPLCPGSNRLEDSIRKQASMLRALKYGWEKVVDVSVYARDWRSTAPGMVGLMQDLARAAGEPRPLPALNYNQVLTNRERRRPSYDYANT